MFKRRLGATGIEIAIAVALITAATSALVVWGFKEEERRQAVRAENYDRERAAMDSWIGQPLSVLLEGWGPPENAFEDGKGGRILTYSKDTRRVEEIVPGISQAKGYRGATHTVRGRITKTLFFVDSNGIVYKWSKQ